MSVVISEVMSVECFEGSKLKDPGVSVLLPGEKAPKCLWLLIFEAKSRPPLIQPQFVQPRSLALDQR